MYVPKYNEEELAAMAKKAETEEAVRLVQLLLMHILRHVVGRTINDFEFIGSQMLVK